MSSGNLVEFLRTVAARSDVLDSLKVKSKDDVIAAAAAFGLPFTEAEFDSLVWDLELRLAEKRQESFDAHFALWRTMWGRYYLEYLVLSMMPSFSQTDLDSLIMAKTEN
jgi:hypothetical protein